MNIYYVAVLTLILQPVSATNAPVIWRRMHVHRNFTAGNFANLSLRRYIAKFSGATNETKIHTATYALSFARN